MKSWLSELHPIVGMNPGTPVSTTALNLIREWDFFVDLPNGVFRKGGNVKVFLDPAGSLGGSQERRPALNSPREGDLGRSLADPTGDRSDDRIRQ